MPGELHGRETELQACKKCGKHIVSGDAMGVPYFRCRIFRATLQGGQMMCRFCRTWNDIPVALTRDFTPAAAPTAA